MPELNKTVVEDEQPTTAMSDDERLDKLNQLGLRLSQTRSEAMEGRQRCGIERRWREDEEYFEGYDQNVKSGGESSFDEKPMGQAVLYGDIPNQSTVFFNITRPYTEAASAKIADMLLPTDDKAFAIRPTPVPDLVGIAKGEIPTRIERQIDEAPELRDEGGQPLPAVDESGQPMMDEQGQPITAAQKTKMDLVEQTKQEIKEAEEKAKRAETRILDWQVECDYPSQVRIVIEDAAKVGSGVLKGPIPTLRKCVAFANGQLQTKKEIVPVSKRISYWNFYPDPNCGQNIHDGAYVWEKDMITRKKLASLIEDPSYISSQIRLCLEEGPQRACAEYRYEDGERAGLAKPDREKNYEIWYFYGTALIEDLEALEIEVDAEEWEDSIAVHMILVNNHVIKAVRNHLDTGEFPYDLMPWQRCKGIPWGMGVARHIRTPQRMVNAAARNLMDNAGIAGGPMIAYMEGVVSPEDNDHTVRPWKVWRVKENAVQNLDQAIKVLKIDMMQEDLQAIIQLALKMAEDVTGMPLLLQGQQGEAPDTVGGMQIINNNASTVSRRIARLFDMYITEPHVTRQYRYLLQYGDDAEKGDYQIDARGSTALVERDIQNQMLMQMATIVTNPVFKKDPVKWVDEFLKSQKLNPSNFDYDDEEWQKIVEQLAQPPKDSSVEVAQLKGEIQKEIEAMKTEREAAFMEREQMFEADQKERDRQIDMMKLEIDKEFQRMSDTDKMNVDLDKLRTSLTEKIMELKTQKELAGMKASADLMKTPATEPPGKAKKGESYQS